MNSQSAQPAPAKEWKKPCSGPMLTPARKPLVVAQAEQLVEERPQEQPADSYPQHGQGLAECRGAVRRCNGGLGGVRVDGPDGIDGLHQMLPSGRLFLYLTIAH